MAPEDVDKYSVVRVADEFVVDLLKTAGGVSFGEAASMVDLVTLEGVSIPFANAELLWRTKQSPREKDRLDRQFLAARRAGEETPNKRRGRAQGQGSKKGGKRGHARFCVSISHRFAVKGL